MKNKLSCKKKDIQKNKLCNNCYNPIYLKFNFSFIQDKLENIPPMHYKFILKRLFELSQEAYNTIASWDKKRGFELEKIYLSKNLPEKFSKSNIKYDDKWCVIRIYPNNNPLPSRIIGKLVNKIFYIMFIDIEGKLYNH